MGLPQQAGERRLSWQPLTPALVPAWHRLTEVLRATDGGSEACAEEELRDDIEPGWVDLPANSVIALDDEGEACAFTLVTIRPGDRQFLRAWLRGGVHPQLRGLGIGRSLMDWALDRGRALVAARRTQLGPALDGSPVPAVAFVVSERDDGSLIPLARRAGFDTLRYFAVMRRDLTGPLPEPPVLPASLRLEPWRAELDQQVRLAHNKAFAAHWLFQPWPEDSWQRWQTGSRTFRPGWSHVVLEAGAVVGYVLNSEHPADATAGREGWTDKIGVLPRCRGRGVAQALLIASMRSFAAAGPGQAGLDVDTGNTTSAIRLYTGLGYTTRERSVQLTMPL